MSNFGLVINDKVVVGPRTYRYSTFNDYLTENSLVHDLPLVKIDDEVIIGEGFSILPVTETIIPTIGKYEQLAGPVLTVYADHIVETYTSAPKNIDAVKNELKTIVTENRYIKETKDVTLTIQGTEVIVEADRENKMNIIQILGVMGTDDVYNFKFPKSNNWIAITKTELGQIVTALVTQTQDAFNWENSIVTAIDSAVDFTSLDLIDIGTEINPVGV